MRHITLFLTAALALILGGSQNAKAEDVIDVAWEDYAVSASEAASLSENDGYHGYVYLYNVASKKFINMGGTYGSRAVGSIYGTPFRVSATGSSYFFKSTVDESYTNSNGQKVNLCMLGMAHGLHLYKVFVDRPSSYAASKWTLTLLDNSKKIYTFKNNYEEGGGYLVYGIMDNDKLYYDDVNKQNKQNTYEEGKYTVYLSSEKTDNSSWAIIPVAKYVEVIEAQAVQTYINVSGLVMNNNFVRNDGTDSWKWTNTQVAGDNISIDQVFGTTGNDDYACYYGAFGAAQIKSENSVKQTVYNLKTGLYAIRAQGFYYNKDNADAASTAYLFTTVNGSTTEERVPFTTLTSEQRTAFEDRVKTHQDSTGNDIAHFRYNVVAADFMSGCDRYEPDETAYSQTVYVTVTALDEDNDQTVDGTTVKAGRGYITLGMDKTSDDGGYGFMDNVKLFYCGNFEFGHDAYTKEADKSSIDTNNYDVPHVFNLRRSFAPYKSEDVKEGGAWNALVLPVSLKGNQVIQTFGEGVKLSKLVGVNVERPTQIEFDAVDVEGLAQKGDEVALEAGEIYAIYVTKNASWYAKSSPYTYLTRNNDVNSNVEMWGPVYHIKGVSRTSSDSYYDIPNYSEGKIEKTIECIANTDKKKYTVKATGYFYRPTAGAPAGSYVLTNGSMYHLQNAWTSLMGTMWYLEVTVDGESTTKPVSFMFDDESGTTGITSVESETSAAEGKIYDLQGRRVAKPSHGIYIMNGKKYIVK